LIKFVKKFDENWKYCRSPTSFKNLNKFEILEKKKKTRQFEKNWKWILELWNGVRKVEYWKTWQMICNKIEKKVREKKELIFEWRLRNVWNFQKVWYSSENKLEMKKGKILKNYVGESF
jgi:hypothetical protein